MFTFTPMLSEEEKWEIADLSYLSLPIITVIMLALYTEISAEISETVGAMKSNHAHKWVTFKLNDDKKVVIDQRGPPLQITSKEEDRKCFDKFVAEQLPQDEPRYALYEFYVHKTGIDGHTMSYAFGFITWNPESANMRTIMAYHSKNDTVIKVVFEYAGECYKFVATSRLDLDYNAMVDQIHK